MISPRVIRGNRGDLLSRWGIIFTLSQMGMRGIDVSCTSQRHLPPTAEARPHAYGKLYNLFPSFSGWRALLQARVVLWVGGLDLQDDSSLVKLCHTLVVFTMYRLLGLRIIVTMQGAGPIETRLGRYLSKCILGLVECFIARDQGSLRLLTGLTSPTRLVLASDGIFLDGFPGDEVSGEEAAIIVPLTENCDGRPLIGINLRLWFHFTRSWVPYQFAKERYRSRSRERMDAFIGAMSVLIAELRHHKGARVLLVSMYEPGSEPWEDDLPLLCELKKRFTDDPEVVVVDQHLGIPAFFTLLSRLDLMVGTRLHSTLTALRGGVPAIHLSYTLKGKDIFSDLKLPDLVVDLSEFIENPKATAELALAALYDPHLRKRVHEAVEAAIARNRAMLAGVIAARFQGGS